MVRGPHAFGDDLDAARPLEHLSQDGRLAQRPADDDAAVVPQEDRRLVPQDPGDRPAGLDVEDRMAGRGEAPDAPAKQAPSWEIGRTSQSVAPNTRV